MRRSARPLRAGSSPPGPDPTSGDGRRRRRGGARRRPPAAPGTLRRPQLPRAPEPGVPHRRRRPTLPRRRVEPPEPSAGAGSSGRDVIDRPAGCRTRRLPAPLALPGHRPPNVLVLDTGLRTRDGRVAHPRLGDHCVLHSPWRDLATAGRWDDEDEPDDDGQGHLDPQAGHGTFISGVIRQHCPDAVIHHRGVLTSYGDGDDASVIMGIERALADRATHPIDLVVMAFGTYAPPVATADGRARSGGCSRTRSSSRRPATTRRPAGLTRPRCRTSWASGRSTATDRRGSRTSDRGSMRARPGSTSSARSSDYDDAGPDGGPGESYRGWARWSGTSFAAPQVAGVIAREQYLHGGSARDAWRRITPRPTLRAPRPRRPDQRLIRRPRRRGRATWDGDRRRRVVPRRSADARGRLDRGAGGRAG